MNLRLGTLKSVLHAETSAIRTQKKAYILLDIRLKDLAGQAVVVAPTAVVVASRGWQPSRGLGDLAGQAALATQAALPCGHKKSVHPIGYTLRNVAK